METKLDKSWFTKELRIILFSLYDPSKLRKSPLILLFDVGQERQPIFTLRRIIISAINDLRPGSNTPQDTKSWRVYQILHRRYVEQVAQRSVAVDLGLSLRQLQREEKGARDILADSLWTKFNIETKLIHIQIDSKVVENQLNTTDIQASFQDQELEWINKTAIVETISINDLIEDVLKTVQPLLNGSKAEVIFSAQASLQPISLKAQILRQALINLLNIYLQNTQKGIIQIQTEFTANALVIRITSQTILQNALQGEDFLLTQKLIQFCGGALTFDQKTGKDKVLEAEINIPIYEHIVLVIDDNIDTQQLYERYLSNSRYQFYGATDVSQGVELALELSPRIIVLDIMMPESDGWLALSQLREHTQTSHIPIVICSIVPQEEIALALGAAEFMRKPIKQADFLAMLDRNILHL